MKTHPNIQMLVAAQILAAANARIEDPGAGGAMTPGVIVASNDARFNEDHFNQALTTFSVGFSAGSDLAAQVQMMLGAPIPVSNRFTYKTHPNVESFLSDPDEDKRAIGSEFSRVEYTGEEKSGTLDNRGLTYRIDRDETDNVEAKVQRVTQQLTERLQRNKLRRGHAKITAAAVNTAKIWDATAGKQPDGDIRAELLVSADLIGMRPNTVIFGENAWSLRQLSYDAQNNAGGYSHAAFTPEQLRSHLMLRRLGVSGARYASSATARSGVLGNVVQMYLTSDGANTDDPASIKHFVKEGGMRVFRQDVGVKFIDVTVEDYDLLEITSALGIRQFTIS